MKMNVNELTGSKLDWAVAKCESVPLVYRGRKWPTDGATTIEYAPWSVNPVVNGAGPYVASLCRDQYSPSVDWSQGGQIIEREKINIHSNMTRMAKYPDYDWLADCPEHRQCVSFTGQTPLIAAMRCYVASKLGDVIDIPEELF